jgi:hypothetical protein
MRKNLNWKNLRNNIPNKIRTKAKVFFDVLWQDYLVDKSNNSCMGITEFSPNQIKLDTMQSDKEAVLTFVHESFHAISDTYELGLTEKQVRKLEKAYPYIREMVLKLEGKE